MSTMSKLDLYLQWAEDDDSTDPVLSQWERDVLALALQQADNGAICQPQQAQP